MNYSLACGVVALALGGCVNDNPFYIDPTGETSSTSADPTMTAGESSTSLPTTEGSTGETGTTTDNTTVGTSVSTTDMTTVGTTTGAVTMGTGDDTGDNTTMPPPECGDGVVTPDEFCDDGNKDDLDDCTVLCLPTPTIDDFLPPKNGALVGWQGEPKPAACNGLFVGMAGALLYDEGIIWAKSICRQAELVELGAGAFKIVAVDEGPNYGQHIGPEQETEDFLEALCPDATPFLVSVHAWATPFNLTGFELGCASLTIVPEQGFYKLQLGNVVPVGDGDMVWAPQATVKCTDSMISDIIVHHYDGGVAGLEVYCSEFDFDI